MMRKGRRDRDAGGLTSNIYTARRILKPRPLPSRKAVRFESAGSRKVTSAGDG